MVAVVELLPVTALLNWMCTESFDVELLSARSRTQMWYGVPLTALNGTVT